VKVYVQTLLEAEDNTSIERASPCDVQEAIHTVKLRRDCGHDGVLNECLRHLPRRPLVHLTVAFGSHIFQPLGRKQK
jgi:hypothetical protein